MQIIQGIMCPAKFLSFSCLRIGQLLLAAIQADDEVRNFRLQFLSCTHYFGHHWLADFGTLMGMTGHETTSLCTAFPPEESHWQMCGLQDNEPVSCYHR